MPRHRLYVVTVPMDSWCFQAFVAQFLFVAVFAGHVACSSRGNEALRRDGGAEDSGSAVEADDAGNSAAHDPGDETPLLSDAANSVSGTVVDFATSRPLAQRTVSVGGKNAMTDAKGQFTLTSVPSTYDAVVTDPDGTTISIYQRLSRRDPLLPHNSLPARATNSAILGGDVSGGGNYPLATTDSVDVYFFSEETDNQFSIGHGLPAGLDGPGYGPISLSWEGADAISGRLMALGNFEAAGDAGASTWFLDRPLTLRNGQMPFVNVALAPVMNTGHITGAIQVPAGSRLVSRGAFYRLPITHALIAIPSVQGQSHSFDDVVPDLSTLGGELCVRANGTPGNAISQRCGVSLGATQDITLTLQPPPSFLTPSSGAAIAKDTRFSWTAFRNGVHLLELESVSPSSRAPRIYVFTSATSVAWQDLSVFGISFPGAAKYRITIAGIGPYSSMDDALAPSGFAASATAELRQSYSYPLYSTTSP
jgi:hypothetical protein